MHCKQYQNYVEILASELIPALGCTEPIAIAYAGALARKTLGCMPERMEVECSGNIIKNVKAVSVPNAGGERGVEVAALLGAIGGDADRELAVLESITDEHRGIMRACLEKKICSVFLIEGDDNLHIVLKVYAGSESALVEIKGTHLRVIRIERNGQAVFTQDDHVKRNVDKSQLNLRDIYAFANEVKIEDICKIVDRQAEYNRAISREGLTNAYGAQIGRLLMEMADEKDIWQRMKAAAAAGSDARMNGCTMPVVINSGSGNQGITLAVPLVEYSEHIGCSKDHLRRAMVLANLIAVLQKRNIGSLSAFCGAVCAATGAACGIAYLDEQPFEVISMTITNALMIVSGMVCDGAKASCAGKIAESLNAAFLGYQMARSGTVFQPGEGLVKADVEQTIQCVGRMGRVGMAATDVEILKMMIEN